MRKTMLAFAAALALGVAGLSTAATAAPHWGHGGWHGGWRGGFWGPGVGLYAFGGPYYGGCWQRRWVPTPFGMRWRLVNVCY